MLVVGRDAADVIHHGVAECLLFSGSRYPRRAFGQTKRTRATPSGLWRGPSRLYVAAACRSGTTGDEEIWSLEEGVGV